MLVSLQWLRELVDTDPAALEPAHLAERLSIAGFEVEEIRDLAAQARGVVVGRVLERQPHPDAAKLSVCEVDAGAAEPLQIVCGAANVRAGIHVPVALVGATLPAVNLTIKPATLRGVASSGMICSLAELGLSDSSDGIAILDELLEPVPPLGAAVGPALGLDDQVLELAITANRPDGLSMHGIAREVAALSGGQPRLMVAPEACRSTPLPVAPAAAAAMDVGGLFSITAIDGVCVGPSPTWLRQRLERAGVRSINNVVDVTNLVMLETGQPLHAFDADRLAADSGTAADPALLGLRQARDNESFLSLDGEMRQLGADALVVTYDDRPVALAGVMGGAAEAVGEHSQRLWLEAAVFAPQAVRMSARSVGLRTEASSRFEKGLPLEATLAAADRAVQLLQEFAGGHCTGRWLQRRDTAPPPPLALRRDALHNLLGPVLVDGEPQDLDDGRIEATLEALGCTLAPNGDVGWWVEVPPSRALDLQREVDLVEEVARLVGYDHFACHLPDPIEPGGLSPLQEAERRLRRALAGAGLQECCSLSLVAASEDRLALANPLLADYGHLRDQLYAELLQAARRNLQTGADGFWGFELGTVFAADGAEHSRLAGVLAGERRSERWTVSGKPLPLTYPMARGVLQEALAALQLLPVDQPMAAEGAPPGLLHPGRSAVLLLEGRSVGWFGQIHPQRADDLDLPEATHLFELTLAPLLVAATRPQRWQPPFTPYPTVPASERDLAVVVSQTVAAADLLQAIRKAGRPLLEHVELIDRYVGRQLDDGTCSQAFRLRYRDPQRTLTDSDVDPVHQQVRASLEQRFKAELRS
ncbi:MAG: phenylalanine--tRNA ligase subunit beta [Cyanobacteriota bacterium]|nr:phenylalanine--tRNA ligase subunit beta [Cyanobacteriota bacterium]